MRIGIFDPYLDSVSGGEKYMMTAASCLAEKHEVFVFWDDPSLLYETQKKFSIDLSKVKIKKNIFSSNFSLLKRINKSREYDAIFYLSDGSIPIVAAKKLFLHFQFPVEWVNGKSMRNRLKLKRVNDIICNSKFTKEFIDKSFGVDSSIIYPPASGEMQIAHIKKENTILSVGRFAQLADKTTFKKQEVMIEIFKKMIDSGLGNWQLILVVSFKSEDEKKIAFLENMVGRYPIKIITNVSSNELTTVYASAKIYWHAAGFGEDLQKHPELAEHFGIATVQAMEQGAVPIVTDAGGQKEIVDEGKNGFLWLTKDELIIKTNLVIKNEDLREKLSGEARMKAEKFSKNAFCKRLTEIIK